MKRKLGNKYMNATPTVHAGKPMPNSQAVGRAETRQDAEGLIWRSLAHYPEGCPFERQEFATMA